MQYPHKPAPTDAPIIDVIKERWSPIAMDSRPIEDEKIKTLFEAARWAPSSYNEQPWRYVYALKEDEHREKLESLLGEGNAWAKNAGLLMITFSKKTFARNGKENRHHMHDLGAATSFIALQCQPLGLVGHQMAGFDFAKANELLDIPMDFVPGSMMAIGYPAEPTTLQKERDQGPRVRKTMKEFAFRGAWKD